MAGRRDVIGGGVVRRLDDHQAQSFCSAKSEQIFRAIASVHAIIILCKWRISAMSSSKLRRSEAEGVAMRAAPFCLPVACEDLRCAAPRPDEARGVCSSYFFNHLTPARCEAKNIVRQFHAAKGPGGAVPTGTNRNPVGNQQAIEIVMFFVSVPAFSSSASRHVCARMCGAARVYMRGVICGTLEPSQLFFINQEVRGSITVPERFRLEPCLARLGINGGFLPILNIIWGGYSAGVAKRAISSLFEARGREKFWDFSGAAVRGGGALASRGRSGRNGGFLRFLGGSRCDVGTALLERCAQSRRNALFSAQRRKPVRLGGRGLRIDRRGGVAPLFAAPLSPITMANEADQILVQHSTLNHWGCVRYPVKNSQRSNLQPGPGEGISPDVVGYACGWRGCKSGSGHKGPIGLRRLSKISAELCDVK